MLNAYAHLPNRTVRVTASEGERDGEIFLGTIDQNAYGPNSAVGDKDSQVLFHHVEGLMIKARLLDRSYSIITDASEAEAEAANAA